MDVLLVGLFEILRMTKDEAIKVLVNHAKRCPEPEPLVHGHPEDYRDEYNEWKERCSQLNEALGKLVLYRHL